MDWTRVLDVRRLRLLCELADRSTIAAVAQALSFSPSSVSQQLAVLEKEAGSRLIEPAGRRVRLTVEGAMLVRHARLILAQVEAAQAALAGARGDVIGTVRIAAFQSVVLSLVLPAVRHIEGRHPRCRVEVTELEPEVSMPALLAGDFDVVIGEEYPGQPLPVVPGIEREHLADDLLELAAPSTWGTNVDLAGLAGRPFALEPTGTTSRSWATTICRTAGFEPDARFTSTDLKIHLQVVQEGIAAALLPSLAGAKNHPGIRLHDLPDHPRRRIFTATRLGSRDHPRISATIGALREYSPSLAA